MILQKREYNQYFKGRKAVVGTKFENLQWLWLVKWWYKQRHLEFRIRWGCSMSTNINREPMEIGETVVTHKCIGTQSSKISLFDLQQEKTFESNSLSNRKHHCTTCIENTTASCKNGEGVLDWGGGGRQGTKCS